MAIKCRVNCTEHNEDCEYCGFNEEEMEIRKKALRAGKMEVNKLGLKQLNVRRVHDGEDQDQQK